MTHRPYIHAVPIQILNLRKYKLLKKKGATVDDWTRLANEYSLADSQRGVDFCMAKAQQIEQKAKGKRNGN
jgi:hypothetical protein